MSVIKINNVCKSFKKGKPVLKNINLNIEKGEMVGLIGPSGSGKSTLLRLLGGFEVIDPVPDSEIEMLGQLTQNNGKKTSSCRQSHQYIGIIFQQFNLVGRLRLLTNVLIGRLGKIPSWKGTLGFFPKEDKIKALEALERVNMVDFAFQRASTLSGGQQQRGAIARVLAQESKIILADEPIASLDPASSDRVMNHLVNINRTDKTTIIVSLHQFEVARTRCERIVALKDGEIIYDGSPENISRNDLINLYGVESADALYA
ncbi:phosphonate ABC transporter ATP-binding protein [Flexistipes sp.]|uniref:phosphonate ABC transporter ATP-binding protein n=1 Tax=Flexistipes sp. TaxID=3088135 RepID=UPI002E248B29|nr:phosphonate ABC transporter ATP-binding protein [Flexistipes sp.]